MVACVSVYGRKWPISQLAVRVRLYFLPVTSKAVYWIWDAKKLSYERRQTHEWINLQLNCVRLKSWWYSRCSNITAWTFFSKWQDHVVEQSFRRTFNAKPWFYRKTSRSVIRTLPEGLILFSYSAYRKWMTSFQSSKSINLYSTTFPNARSCVKPSVVEPIETAKTWKTVSHQRRRGNKANRE